MMVIFLLSTKCIQIDINLVIATDSSRDPYFLEAKDPYIHRTLPHLIASQPFFKDENVGLSTTYSDEEGGKAGNDYGSLSESESSSSSSDNEPQDEETEDEESQSKDVSYKIYEISYMNQGFQAVLLSNISGWIYGFETLV